MKNLINGLLALLFGTLSACGVAQVAGENKQAYYCIGGSVPLPQPNTVRKRYTTEEFEYGEYKINESTIAKGIFGHTRCGDYSLAPTAYLRYRLDDQVIEKRFNLSSLTPQRVANKTVEFYVDGETVEVRLLTPVPGRYTDIKEVIDRQ